jgi:hypothetical protein
VQGHSEELEGECQVLGGRGNCSEEVVSRPEGQTGVTKGDGRAHGRGRCPNNLGHRQELALMVPRVGAGYRYV